MAMSLLFVCRANVCRSPAAELMLRHEIPMSLVQVGSAGLEARDGLEIDQRMSESLRARGVSGLGNFRSRLLLPTHLEQAEIVLTTTLRQRRVLAERRPGMVNRVFTVREFAILLDVAPLGESVVETAGLAENLLIRAWSGRGRHGRNGNELDIEDPFGRSRRHYERAVDELQSAISSIASAVKAIAS